MVDVQSDSLRELLRRNASGIANYVRVVLQRDSSRLSIGVGLRECSGAQAISAQSNL